KKRHIAVFQEEERLKEEALAKQGRIRKKGERKVRPPELPPPPDTDAEPLTSSDEDTPMYFSRPGQLLDIFQALEEQNLFLIQNSQETEHALEELQGGYRAVQRAMDAKTAALRRNVDGLSAAIAAEDARADQLRRRVAGATGDALQRQEALLRELNLKVKEVYEQCEFDAGSKPTTLFMLSDLEARLEDLLAAIAQMPEEYVARAEKEKEKRRRSKKRAEQQAEMELAQEERNRKAIQRSLQAPRRRTGRPVMFRSRLVRQEKREDK
ncbi:unnamed protein product, partial [Phaeothamnion confervicola]